MEECKYRLPCGRCDKYDEKCDALKDCATKECEHSWVIEVSKSNYINAKGEEHCIVNAHCRKCGTNNVRVLPFKT